MLKKCPKCNESKPLEAFYKDSKSSSGRSSYCVDCTRQRVQVQKSQRKNKPRNLKPITKQEKEILRQKSKQWYLHNRLKVAQNTQNKRVTASLSTDASIEWKLKKMLNSARSRAAAKNLHCNIDMTFLRESVVFQCPVDGMPLDWSLNISGTHKTNLRSPSLDRICSHRGYTHDNVVIMSTKWNLDKKDMNLAEMQQLLKYVQESACGQWRNYELISDIFLHRHVNLSGLSKDQARYYQRNTTVEGLMMRSIESIKARCKNKKIAFNVDWMYLASIATVHCPISGKAMDWKKELGSGKPHFYSPSIDRINPSQGYTPGNLRFIANGWNTRKGSLDINGIKTLIDYMERNS